MTKDQETSSSQSRVGSTVWLQRWIREAQDIIVELREVQQMVGEKNKAQSASSNLGKGSCVGDA
jgi:hypothetical protein